MKVAGGKLYGTTAYGGASNAGVIFEFNPADGSFAKKVDLSDALGKYPFAGLVVAPGGKLYGVTREGGSMGDGVLFSFDPATADYTPLWFFSRETSGAQPIGALTLASGGLFYGLATKAVWTTAVRCSRSTRRGMSFGSALISFRIRRGPRPRGR